MTATAPPGRRNRPPLHRARPARPRNRGSARNAPTDSVAIRRAARQNRCVTDLALDDVNKQIIEHLQRDGRMSYATLAKIIGLSEAAVRQRVQRLLDGGLMQIVAVTDPLTLGFARQAMVGIKVQRRHARDRRRSWPPIPEVDYVVICAGGFDLLVELVCTDDEHLLRPAQREDPHGRRASPPRRPSCT